METAIFIVHNRKSGVIYGIFKDFAFAKQHKADLMNNGINAGIDKAKTDFLS